MRPAATGAPGQSAYSAAACPEKSGIRARAVRRSRSTGNGPRQATGPFANRLTMAHGEPASRTKSAGFFSPQIWSRVHGPAASAGDQEARSARAAIHAIATAARTNSFADEVLMAVVRLGCP